MKNVHHCNNCPKCEARIYSCVSLKGQNALRRYSCNCIIRRGVWMKLETVRKRINERSHHAVS